MRLLQSILALTLAASSATAVPSESIKRREISARGQRVDTKYFHEPGGDNELGHYDIRYFKQKVPYEEHRPALQHLIRSYLTTFRSLGVETWLAHGTLLGWWWNGRIMPWDYDLDVQVSAQTLYYLGNNLNRTTHEYNYFDPISGKPMKKEYLLDINPHHSEITRGDGQNVIDARWIDLSNGMFIDITGLAERDSHSPGVWSCKNFHKYRTTELYPMRETEFEGVPATIPYSFDYILTDEYGHKSLVTTQWAGHRWEPELKEWIKIPKDDEKKEEDKEQKA
ncbi:LicD family-domain-containing protein [Pseudomassariella vexata]|uniref:LicD family-domain-containing protein n=1 Tax=Pseudomassariella vexata TaxID=1141098 RepID=A0A1Y2DZU0_9PEZI|nr:LicD family-domain-containing protein [Pseudomassariella vexata]ORY64145.1 LicD family-domain-containing protein [Pseudomassariella vexata]